MKDELLKEWLWRMKILDKTKGDRLFTIKDYSDLVFIIERMNRELIQDFTGILNSYIIGAKAEQNLLISEGYGKAQIEIGKKVIDLLEDIKKEVFALRLGRENGQK